MNPIYKFTITANGIEHDANPVYGNDLAKEIELQTNQQFYREKLSGKLSFIKDDYDFIAAQDFDTRFSLLIFISYDGGESWPEYWAGYFWKTDGAFNDDDKVVTLTPTVFDQYIDVLAGMEKEYNLIELAPEIVPVKLDKRPMIQVYVPGQTVIGCFLSGMWWEQECKSVTNETNLEQVYHFYKVKTNRIVDVEQTGTPTIPDVFLGSVWSGGGTHTFTNDGYEFQHVYQSGAGGSIEKFSIYRVSDNQLMWQIAFQNQLPKTYPIQLTLQPVSGSGATGTVDIYIHDVSVWARYVCDVDSAMGLPTYQIPDNDIVPNNRNYSRIIGYNVPSTIFFSSNLSDTPTPWGLYKPGKYYQEPNGSWVFGDFFPVARNAWGRASIWFAFYALDWIAEKEFRKDYTLRDAFPLASVISVLLSKIAPNLTHQETTAYSEFLYGENPLSGINQRIFITPKSNMISLGYDQPAQKAPITLKTILDMLRDCFRCYWFVDGNGRFRIEHIEYFRRGGTYRGSPAIGRNLTIEQETRNGKKWAFCTSKYNFDKPEMAARYQFGWMDDVTQLFEGNPIDIVSSYVNPEKIEQINVSQFTSDVDYILLNPSEISKDGFVLLAATLQDGEYKLPYLNVQLGNSDHVLQNAYVAFVYLQQYYFWDMPARNFICNGEPMEAFGVSKLKTQTLKFPSLYDPNTLRLIKTNIGNGVIQKMSVNLSSRMATTTLKYDTDEQ